MICAMAVRCRLWTHVGLNFRADIDPVMAAKVISRDLLFTCVYTVQNLEIYMLIIQLSAGIFYRWTFLRYVRSRKFKNSIGRQKWPTNYEKKSPSEVKSRLSVDMSSMKFKPWPCHTWVSQGKNTLVFKHKLRENYWPPKCYVYIWPPKFTSDRSCWLPNLPALFQALI